MDWLWENWLGEWGWDFFSLQAFLVTSTASGGYFGGFKFSARMFFSWWGGWEWNGYSTAATCHNLDARPGFKQTTFFNFFTQASCFAVKIMLGGNTVKYVPDTFNRFKSYCLRLGCISFFIDVKGNISFILTFLLTWAILFCLLCYLQPIPARSLLLVSAKWMVRTLS